MSKAKLVPQSPPSPPWAALPILSGLPESFSCTSSEPWIARSRTSVVATALCDGAQPTRCTVGVGVVVVVVGGEMELVLRGATAVASSEVWRAPRGSEREVYDSRVWTSLT